MRKELSFLLVILAYALLGWWMGELAMPVTTLTVGAGSITLVQSGAVVSNPNNPSASLSTPSTAGTTLIAVIGSATTGPRGVTSAPVGWTVQDVKSQGTATQISIWAYGNNPGGVSAVTFVGDGVGTYYMQLSEWTNLAVAAASGGVPVFSPQLEVLGEATATAGTTLPVPVTSGAITHAGDLVISAWIQLLPAGAAPAVFTTPASFTRLADNGATSLTQHMDVEYLIAPTIGSQIAPTLTSDQVTFSAAGLTVGWFRANQALDETAFITNGTIHAKLNTLDLGLMLGGRYVLESATADGYLLEDGSGVLLMDTYLPKLGDPVVLRYSPT